ncbi:universal stress protein [Ligilactobacillus equi]|uniref:universal stress protein n=1 Tax=Ligilactobacillus equi TaxID=137357 RepID=UPI002ED0BF31|nr:universal stress protein [Ligilactobacillus sp.]
MSQDYKKILVTIDGSKGSEIALQTALDILERSKDGHLDILSVLDLNSLEYGGAGIALDGEKIYQIEQDNEEYLLQKRQNILDEYHLAPEQVSVHLRFGNPKSVIVNDFQPEYENDLIVVGATGKNFLQRIIVGSVASYVTRAARCDVLIAKDSSAE